MYKLEFYYQSGFVHIGNRKTCHQDRTKTIHNPTTVLPLSTVKNIVNWTCNNFLTSFFLNQTYFECFKKAQTSEFSLSQTENLFTCPAPSSLRQRLSKMILVVFFP